MHALKWALQHAGSHEVQAHQPHGLHGADGGLPARAQAGQVAGRTLPDDAHERLSEDALPGQRQGSRAARPGQVIARHCCRKTQHRDARCVWQTLQHLRMPQFVAWYATGSRQWK